MTMTDIKSMTQEEITDALRAMGEPAFRGKQVFSWLHKGATDFAEMNKAYARFFPDSKPARVCYQVSALPKGAKVEIDAIAGK